MYNVLIAEDDFHVAEIHEQYLSKFPEMTLVGKAMNAKETMGYLDKENIDLILLDVYMPDMLGTELLEQIRKQSPQVDIIMITAATDKAFLEKALHYGVQHYMIKPVTLEQFSSALKQYLRNKKVLQSMEEVDQETVNHLFGSPSKVPEKSVLPSGIDYLTLKKVSEILTAESQGITSEEVGAKMGASRTTARRYLEYLVGIGQADVEHAYGIVGRPERRYHAR
ncbi:response regulator [Radiobacillus kanasensis]|uniref:response regulator n=1 Tax=Radiobacillus kanasensis TaxID=2844358 RepID=UPI001E29D66E|nr:response regulator [Radiobacillus kanasensis]UFU00791.1 response regulator [Radiobacillus kanasensis]